MSFAGSTADILMRAGRTVSLELDAMLRPFDLSLLCIGVCWTI